jgi:hypothetical protein
VTLFWRDREIEELDALGFARLSADGVEIRPAAMLAVWLLVLVLDELL